MSVMIKAEDIHQYCRICFQSTSEVVSCLTKLVIGDISCTIVEILKLLSQQNVSKICFKTFLCATSNIGTIQLSDRNCINKCSF